MSRLFATIALIGAIASMSGVGGAWAQEKGLWLYGARMEEFEYRKGDEGEKLAVWNGDAYVGTDELKLRWLGQGEYDTRGDSFETLENRLVLQVPISTHFDLMGGVRVDTPTGTDRWFGVLGVEGLAPQWIEVNANFFVSETGDASGRLGAGYEILLTNRLILRPSAEMNIAFSDDREIGVGSGINDFEVGMRLGYDIIDRAVTPYFGFVYERKLGQTADFARAEGEDIEGWRMVIGARLMF